MARTKTILVPVGTAAGDGTTGSSANTGPPGVQETLRVRAQDGDGSDLDGNNAPQDREATPEQDDEGGAARRDTTGPAMMTTLTTVLQQLVTSTDRMEARMHVIETQRSTAAIGSSATSGPPETTTGRTQDTSARSEPAPATTLTATMQRGPAPTVFGRRGGHGDDPDGGDGSDDSADSSSGDERGDGGNGGPSTPALAAAPRRTPRNRRRAIRDLELPTFQPSPMVSVSTWIARVDLALQGVRLSGSGDWTDNELYYILGNKLQDNAARWWVQMDQEVRDGEKT
ncbi:hypothetical protein PF005_g8917 [Phytophthora fragariae]|uniref:Retrotransposon gag domain-containing protein n=1 Tax=Phytophthora fragariae TaxID=53985 RepID=A0A6A3U402_9STRA|nr:hypothetical protein PF007_g8749 [Phytophthora fragariae]KAE9145878.1 hypothetical protein PF006_g9306 [Phytophthora fragariae]KAE9216747.1 hypothetical protein PF005_g8917 [Phytophthora fragariae]KAE9314730.1 hypothetical protein PF001_g8136 [Phytophthora fragariae]KAE9356361.1 hypothetical protein PF008_g3645 [Phytophthora fragariae]